MKEIINFSILDCRRVAQLHAVHISKYGNLKVVYNNKPQVSDEIAGKYNLTAYHDFDNVLSEKLDMDVIAIFSPNGLHAEHSLKIVKVGYPAHHEKPMPYALQIVNK